MPPIMYGEKKGEDTTAEDGFFCSAIRKLPPTPSGTVRLFDRQDFFSAYGLDAFYVADTHFKTQTVIKYLGKPTKDEPNGLASCTLSNAVAQSFLRDALTTKQLRIEIYTSDGPKSTRFKLSKSASPGNLGPVEELLFANSDMLQAPIILSLLVKVKDNVKTVGVAFADTSEMTLGVSQFDDNDLFSNLESLLIQMGVKEVLLPSDEKSTDYDLTKIRVIIERCGIVATDRKKGEFVAKDVEQDLNRLLRGNLTAAARPEFDLKVAMAATSALISYLNLLTDDSNHSAYLLKGHDLTQFMKLDASALRALNLMPDPTGMSGSNKNMSVFGLLNRCRTSQGTRMLAQWLKQPLVNLHMILARQDLVECFFEDSEMRSALIDDFLKSMPDFHRISKRFQKGAANLEDVVRVYQAILLLPGLTTVLENGGQDNERWKELIEEHFLVKLREYAVNLYQLQQMVETTIDLEELNRHNYVIKPEFDEDLQSIKDKMSEVRDQLDQEHSDVAEDLGFDTDQKVLHFEQHQTYGYCFRLTRKEASVLKGKSKYTELIAKSNGVHFTTKNLKSLDSDYREYLKSYDRKQASLVKEVITIAASYCSVLESLNSVIANMDVIASLAIASLNAPTAYVKPTMVAKGKGSLKLVESRHPCLEMQDGVNFIANDIALIRDESEFQIITGPNMGGKSTYIRQAGVIALMAQMGCFVPCDEATVPVFDSILCRVGAGDSQLKGVSTFMAEMLETAVILKSATRDSLVIIDELGRGTSTYDGFGLAWAISEHLATETRASVLFASHFHELTALAKEVPHVQNLHVVAHVETKPDSLTGKEITLLYKVEPGVCDQSFGIHVAELAKFPTEVIKLAKRKADDLEDFSENPSEAHITSTISSESTAAGTALVAEMLAAWASASEELDQSGMVASSGGDGDDADVEMGNGNAEEEMVEREYKLLKKCFGEYKTRLDESEWASKVLVQTY